MVRALSCRFHKHIYYVPPRTTNKDTKVCQTIESFDTGANRCLQAA